MFAQLTSWTGCLQMLKSKQNSHGNAKETIDPIPEIKLFCTKAIIRTKATI